MDSIHILRSKNSLVSTFMLLIPVFTFGLILLTYLLSNIKTPRNQIATESGSSLVNSPHWESQTVLGDQDSIDTEDF